MKLFANNLSPIHSTWGSPIPIIYRVIIWLPWVWLTLFCMFVSATAVQVGHLPTYGQPDPRYIGLISTLFYVPIILLLIGVVGTTPVGIILAIVSLWKRFPESVRREELAFYLSGIGVFYLFVLSDIAGLMTWLAD